MNTPTTTTRRIPVIVDLSSKKWLNEKEAIVYLGMGNANTFQHWRNTGLQYYQPGRKILYKRADLDKWIEQHQVKGF
ncbi:helix-turn-helix domain-containing protein [Sunxiuqinia indica]|uniref:helix-turn-helix domain-containing protein n=1 Tax=Sunxiuqinia indica TaxID=2692584 RepID=UPI0013579661|nr:helix-turn-helix domain-containing protein [Sunxiuqinia indica]